jgi:hypothetical protein
MIKKLRERGSHSPLWAAEPKKIIIMQNICNSLIFYTLQKPNLNNLDFNVSEKYGLLLFKMFIYHFDQSRERNSIKPYVAK